MACNACGDCQCRVIAGSGAVVTGTGRQFDPYIVSVGQNTFTVQDTDCINLDLTGIGSQADPYEVTATLNLHPSADNLIVCDGDGLLVDCDTVVDCVGNNIGCGLEFNNGSICVAISEDTGNQLECRPDGLYASFDCDDLGCGLTMVNGEITVNVGGANRAAGKAGLTCDEATGILGVDPGCGLAIQPNGRLGVNGVTQVRAENTVGDRFANLPIPNVATPAAGEITDANGRSTVQNCITLTNDTCAPVQGFVVVRYQFEALVGNDRDIEAQIQILEDGIWRQAEEIDRHYHDGGGREIFSSYGERTVALGNLNPGNSIQVCYRLMLHRARTPGDLTGDPAAQATLLSYSMTVQGLLNWNQ